MSDDLETTDEPDPTKLEEFRARQQRHAEGNGEAAVGPQEASYDIPPPPTPEQAEHACVTAFVVVVEPDGRTWANGSLECVPTLQLQRPANLGDMYRACIEVAKDVQCMETVERTIQALAQVWPQISAQTREMERQQKIANKLVQQGIHVPGR